ncbi:acyl-CoA dehydrogenase family protein [Candidimonas nitroreducens]|uniref:Acyl-CoA dehydrogenase n=1 Tax=Candidimonas nitroreducens TaxID=683354 RepID=A0A225MCH4_9BURK|nr:acyl-CoA dehydrogenase family protein [Candidimonas nitroreducens]OWT58985.1 acyl-CoA dehydrogenase [Candidimonas nitroreducens]
MMASIDRRAMDDDGFRAEWRSWIAANYPSEMRNPLEKLTGEEARTWLRAQFRDGWRAPGLPVEAGGLGLPLPRQLIYQEELDRYGVARPLDHGLRMVAPILLRYGSQAQREHYLPRILACEDVWCQGYSEPNAGSDLAGLKTSGRIEGDCLVINGQKIWTTLATDANMMYMLVRTGGGTRKQEGITFVLVPLSTPGIRIRPIRTLAGEEHLCEVFFDEVVVPLANVVGEIGQGWTVGKALLGFERWSHGSPELIRYALKVLRQTAEAMGMAQTERYCEMADRYICDVDDSAALYEQVCRAAVHGKVAEEDFSMLKLFNAELLQRIVESTMDLAGQCGGIADVAPELGLTHDLEWLYMITRPVTIFGGTSQVQRNLLAVRALHLPKD